MNWDPVALKDHLFSSHLCNVTPQSKGRSLDPAWINLSIISSLISHRFWITKLPVLEKLVLWQNVNNEHPVKTCCICRVIYCTLMLLLRLSCPVVALMWSEGQSSWSCVSISNTNLLFTKVKTLIDKDFAKDAYTTGIWFFSQNLRNNVHSRHQNFAETKKNCPVYWWGKQIHVEPLQPQFLQGLGHLLSPRNAPYSTRLLFYVKVQEPCWAWHVVSL